MDELRVYHFFKLGHLFVNRSLKCHLFGIRPLDLLIEPVYFLVKMVLKVQKPNIHRGNRVSNHGFWW